MEREALIILLFLVFGSFEYFFPAEREHSRKGKLSNVVIGVFLLTVGSFISLSVFRLLSGYLPEVVWQGPKELISYVVAYVFLVDFFYYWFHRAQHKFLSLWVLHELHHSEAELNIFSSFRTYWLDYPAQTLFVLVPTTLILGFFPLGIALAMVPMTFMLIFAHSNLKLDLGPFSRVIVGPQVHRIHHSKLPEHRGLNLAMYFPIFDIIFGTYYHPRPGEFPPTGTNTMKTDESFSRVLLKPFSTWLRQIKKAIASKNTH